MPIHYIHINVNGIPEQYLNPAAACQCRAVIAVYITIAITREQQHTHTAMGGERGENNRHKQITGHKSCMDAAVRNTTLLTEAKHRSLGGLKSMELDRNYLAVIIHGKFHKNPLKFQESYCKKEVGGWQCL